MVASAISIPGQTKAPLKSRVRPGMFLPYQRKWQRDESVIKVMRGSRRIGKDYGDAWQTMYERVTGKRNVDFNYSSRDELVAKEYLEYVVHFCKLMKFLAKEIWDYEIFNDKPIYTGRVIFPEIDGKKAVCRVLSSSPGSFRGMDGDIGLSELAFHENPEALWGAASPATMLGGRIRVLSTVNVEGDFFERICGMGARRAIGQPKPGDMDVSLHTVTIHDALDQGLLDMIARTRKKVYTREAFLAEVRSKCIDQEQWEREFECKPSGQVNAYLPFGMTRPCIDDNVPVPTMDIDDFTAMIAASVARVMPDAMYAGVDVAKTGDLFVVWVLGRAGAVLHTLGVLFFNTVVLKKLNKAKRTFDTFKQLLMDLMQADWTWRSGGGASHTLSVARMCVDRTGMGENLAENLEYAFGHRVEGVVFNNKTKAEMFPLARERVEHRGCTLPNDMATLSDFASVKQIVTASGHARYDAARNEGSHADRANAFTLAVHACESRIDESRFVEVEGGADY